MKIFFFYSIDRKPKYYMMMRKYLELDNILSEIKEMIYDTKPLKLCTIFFMMHCRAFLFKKKM